MNENAQWFEAGQCGVEGDGLEGVRPLERIRRWALSGTVAAQVALVAFAFGRTTLIAQLMAAYFLTLLFAICVASLGERGVSEDVVASVAALGTFGYVLIAGRWTAWAPPLWIGVACLAVLVTTGNRNWSAFRAAALCSACGTMAALETHRFVFLVWAAAAAVPFALAQISLVRGGAAAGTAAVPGPGLEGAQVLAE
ncbi:MAG: hypothetical protein ACYDCL_19030 [Myxococcales bacterium]